jgi:hypothetical protein
MIAKLPAGYTLHHQRGKGLRGGDLIAIVRPNGEPVLIGEPPLVFSRKYIKSMILDVIYRDLALQKKEGRG